MPVTLYSPAGMLSLPTVNEKGTLAVWCDRDWAFAEATAIIVSVMTSANIVKFLVSCLFISLLLTDCERPVVLESVESC